MIASSRAVLGLLGVISTLSAASARSSFQPYIRQQPSAHEPPTDPSRPLIWGDLQVLHTTDTHGWLAGHLAGEAPEPSYSGDWGDFYSFVQGLKKTAEERGVDLLLVDSGDLHDGTGLGDLDPIIKGATVSVLFRQMPYDVLTVGNHELYQYEVALDFYKNFVPHWKGRYLTSNVNLTIPRDATSSVTGAEDKHTRSQQVFGLRNPGELGGHSRPMGAKYRKFKTLRGRKVTAFGVLFNFTKQDIGIDVRPAAEMVKEEWFLDAVQDPPDVFLLVGHLPANSDEWEIVHGAIRQVHPKVPILIFGGHNHIRDCRQLDDRSMALGSGRYMEGIGWMSVSGLSADNSQPLTFHRRYIDQNRRGYAWHLGNPSFDTIIGRGISKTIDKVSTTFNLTRVLGHAPQSYFVSRFPSSDKSSVISLFVNEVLPHAVQPLQNRTTQPLPFEIFFNTGSLRFDILKGPYTINDLFLIYPFANKFLYLHGVPLLVSTKLLAYLNEIGEHLLPPSHVQTSPSYSTQSLALHEDRLAVDKSFDSWKRRQWQLYQSRLQAGDVREAEVDLTYGYVTTDQCGPEPGEDTPHRPIPWFEQPAFAATALRNADGSAIAPQGEPDPEQTVDLVFVDFILPFVVRALNVLQQQREWKVEEARLFSERTSVQTLRYFVETKWGEGKSSQ